MSGSRALAGIAGALVACVAADARAAGLYFSDRGVRPLSRGAAFVAGADDLGAIYYNPAGLADAGSQVLVDASWLHFTSGYQRVARVRQVDPATQQPTGQAWDRTFPKVEGTSPVLPIPTIAASHGFGLRGMNFAVGLLAPYAAITTYPEKVGGEPAPQRYSLLTLEGSALAYPGVWASFRPAPEIALGAGVGAFIGTFSSSVAFTSCIPDRFACAIEEPEWDAVSQMTVGPIVSPSGNFGALVTPDANWRIGASFQLPVWVDAPARVSVRLPSTPVFDGASQDGDRARVSFRLPWIARAGVEHRVAGKTRVEAAFVYEAWSMHDAIRIVPEGVVLRDVKGFPPEYRIGAITMPRGFRDAYSVRLGGEHPFELGGYPLDVRAGVMWERSAVPREYLSVMTVDLDKVVLTIGGSLHIGRWRFDGVYARIVATPTEVDPDEARVPQVNPVRANPPPAPNYVNGGRYTGSADVLGTGVVYKFD